MRITLLYVAPTLALLASGCYSPSFEPCAVSCSATSACPDNLVCNAADGFCHAPDDTASCTAFHTVTVVASGTGSGQITSDVGGIGCAPLCNAQIAEGTRVTLTATPSASSRFTGWLGAACSGTASCSFIVSGPIQVGAGFNAALGLSVGFNGTGGGTVTSAPSGINCTDDCNGQFESGTQVTLTAAPDATSRFAGWVSACAGTSGTSCNLSITSPTNAGVNFVRTALVTVAPAGNGTGTVVSAPAGIACPNDCTERLDTATQVTLTAAATGASVFRSWAGGPCNGSPDPVCVFALTGDVAAVPTFVERRTVTVNIVGAEGSVTGDVACRPGPCASTFDVGTAIMLAATGTAKWRFDAWSSPPCANETTPCTFNLATDVAPTATFIQQRTLSVAVSGGVGGMLVPSAPGVSCVSCDTVYDTGAVVTIDAVANPAFRFTGWGGACTSEPSTRCTVQMSADLSATATFVATVPLTLVVSGAGKVAGTGGGATVDCPNASCTANVDLGTAFPLTITPDMGARLISVTGCVGAAPCSVLMDMARTVTIAFAGGDLSWFKEYGGLPYFGREFVEDVVVDGAGRVIVAGAISGETTMNFDGVISKDAARSQQALMVARYSTSGNVEWAHVITPTNVASNANASASSIAVASNGDVLIGGSFTGTLAIPGTTVSSAGGFDGFVLHLSSNGDPVALYRFGSIGDEGVRNIAFTSGGDLDLLVRAEAGTFTIGSGSSIGLVVPSHSEIVASVGPGFVHRWAKVLLPLAPNTQATRLIIGVDDSALLVGHYGGVGPGPNFGGVALANGQRITSFIVKLADVDGSHVWSDDYGGASPGGGLNNVRMVDAKLDALNNVTVVGWFDNNGSTVEDVSGVVSAAPLLRQGPRDMFAATYSSVNGDHLSSFRFGSTETTPGGDEIPVAFAIDLAGNLVVAGSYTVPSITIGPETITNLGMNDVFVLKMSSSGVGAWIRGMRGAAEERVTAIDVATTGVVSFGGTMLGDHTTATPFSVPPKPDNTCTFGSLTFARVDDAYLITLLP